MLQRGTRLGDQGRYELVARLGQGGMGTVYEAFDTRMQKRVAVKLLAPEYAHNPRVCERFRREGLIQANLDHPNVVLASDIVEGDGQLGLVMEYVDGPSLEDYIVQRGALGLGEAWAILGPVCDAVHAAHLRGIVHRDLKPGNVMLAGGSGGDPRPKLLDFGIAKLLADAQGSAPRTQVGAKMGTPGYMSPEQLKGSADVDHRTDIYALGVITYQLLTGTVPYPGTSTYEVIAQVISGPAPPPPTTIVAGLPPDVDEIIAAAMAADQLHRFQSVEAFAAALHRLAADGPTGPYPKTERPRISAPPAPPAPPAPSAPTITDAPPTGSQPPPAQPHPSPPPPTPLAAPPSPPIGGQSGRRGLIFAAVGIGVAVLALAGLALRGTGGDSGARASTAVVYPRCNQASDCRANETCEDGRCGQAGAAATTPVAALTYPACRSAGDCRAGERCEGGRCATPPPPPPQTGAAAAEAAYRSILGAYNAQDSDTYFGGFEYPIPCMYRPVTKGTRQPWTRSHFYDLRKSQFTYGGSRFDIHALDVILDRGDEVHLREHSTMHRNGKPSVDVRRRIALRRRGGQWLIFAEGNPTGGCFPR